MVTVGEAQSWQRSLAICSSTTRGDVEGGRRDGSLDDPVHIGQEVVVVVIQSVRQMIQHT